MPTPDDRDDEATFWREQRTHRASTAELDHIRVEAGSVACPDCHAVVDVDCVNGVTGEPLRRLPCHARRLTEARKAGA